jgi:hypothetical protein
MNQDYCIPSGKYDIGASRESAVVDAESESPSVETLADCELYAGIAPADPGHHPAARRAIDNVSHDGSANG